MAVVHRQTHLNAISDFNNLFGNGLSVKSHACYRTGKDSCECTCECARASEVPEADADDVDAALFSSHVCSLALVVASQRNKLLLPCVPLLQRLLAQCRAMRSVRLLCE